MRIMQSGNLFFGLGAFIANQVLAEGKQDDYSQMLSAWSRLSPPGRQHRLLQPLAGEWDLQAAWQHRDSTSGIYRASSKRKWIMGHRFLLEEVRDDKIGAPFNGVGILGYDNLKRQFASFWIDEMSTSMVFCAGQEESDGRSISLTGTYDDPLTGERNRRFKNVITIADNNQHVFEMFEIAPDGDCLKMYDIVYTRSRVGITTSHFAKAPRYAGQAI